MPATNRVRYEMLRRLGYFVTESSEHFSEYVPWFIKDGDSDLIERFNIPLDEYIERCKAGIISWQLLEKAEAEGRIPDEEEILYALRDVNPMHKGWTVHSVTNLNKIERSVEYGSLIIHSMETGQAKTIYGNVPNENIIENLPARMLCRGALFGGWQRCASHAHRDDTAASGRVDADQYQCAVADGGSGADRQTRAYLPRCHA